MPGLVEFGQRRVARLRWASLRSLCSSSMSASAPACSACSSSRRSITSSSESSRLACRRSSVSSSCCSSVSCLASTVPLSSSARSRSSRWRTASISPSSFATCAVEIVERDLQDGQRGRWPRGARPARRRAPAARSGSSPVRRSGSARRRARPARAATLLCILRLSCSCFSSTFHGSVRTSDRPAPAATRRSGCAAARPPGRTTGIHWPSARRRRARRPSPAVFVGGMMAQVGGDVGLHVRCGHASSSESPAPPQTATRDTTRRGSPAARTPHDVAGSARAHPGHERRTAVRAAAARRCGRGRRRRATAPARRRRTRAPRRDARRAARRAPARAPGAGAITSTRSSATCSTAPTAPIAGVAPSCGRNCRCPATLQLQLRVVTDLARARGEHRRRAPRRRSRVGTNTTHLSRPGRPAPATARRSTSRPSASASASDTPGDARVGVGVRGEQGATGADQPVHQRALGGVGGHRVHAAQQQRVVRQQQTAVGHLRRRPPAVASTAIVTESTVSDGSPHTRPTESQLCGEPRAGRPRRARR